MTAEPDPAGLSDRLQALIVSGHLPSRATGTAQKLLDRLRSPVRLALLGAPGAGKSTVANVLCGSQILPINLRLPTSKIAYGDAETLTVTTRDGTRHRVQGLDLKHALSLKPLFIEIEAPLEALRGISLLEVVTDGSSQEMAAASAWAARRTDMAIWITRNFGAEEQALWDAMPEKLQRHAFLVLNGLDDHGGDAARKLISTHRATGRHRFLDVFPVSAGNAAAGLSPDGPAIPRTAGCGALLDGLAKRVALGRQADMDTVQLFLQRHGDAVPAAPASREHPAHPQSSAAMPSASRVPATAAPAAPLPATAVSAAPAPATAIPAAPAALTAAPDAAPPTVQAAEAAAPPPPVSEPMALSRLGALGAAAPAPAPGDGADDDGHAQALDLLTANARGWLQALEDPGGWESDRTLRAFCETADRLEALLPVASPLHDTVHQLSDYLLLLQVEQDASACVDGAAALLQVRRDLEAVAAA